MGETGESDERPIFRDIRRYYCQYCGICRSKKTLLTSHINSSHKEELERDKVDQDQGCGGTKSNTCKECGVSFKKPAYLVQHMLSHSLERPYVCSIDDCQASYRRKDHLTRHFLKHKGKTFKCPIEDCNHDFTFQGNMTKHVREFHKNSTPAKVETQKQHECPEPGCGKVFKFASKLQKHENCHVKLESVEVVCLEPGCMKHFTNVQCLDAHIKTCHKFITCETCGKMKLKKNIKRHLRAHEETGPSAKAFKCEHNDCSSAYTTKSSLQKHVKAVHLKEKPFVCRIPDCGMRFSYKHVRDNHEKTGLHVYTRGDFEESDVQFRSKPRGGRKRQCPTVVDMLARKRITPPSQLVNCLFGEDINNVC